MDNKGNKCDKCYNIVNRRKKLKLLFQNTSNKKQKLQIGRQWKKLSEVEAMLCSGCMNQYKKDYTKAYTNYAQNIPKIRQWPNSKSCYWCQEAIKQRNKLNLYNWAKGNEHKILALCNTCIYECKQQIRSCPDAKITRDLLEKRAISKMP